MQLPRSRVSFLCWGVLLCGFLGFATLLVFSPSLYAWVSREDRPVEYLGFFFLFLTSITLLASGYKSRTNTFQMIIFAVTGLAFFWAAGEEISWGQRIFDLATPSELAKINHQKELNIHNIDKMLFDKLVERINIVLFAVPLFAHLSRKEKLWGFKLPDVFLTLGFAMIPFYRTLPGSSFHFYQLGYIAMFLYLGCALYKKEPKVVFACLGTLAVSYLTLHIHTEFRNNFPKDRNGINEIREMFFCFGCWAYSLFLFREVCPRL